MPRREVQTVWWFRRKGRIISEDNLRAEQVEARLRILSDLCERLVNVSGDCFAANLEHSDDDSYGLVVVTFAAKQHEHMRSLLALLHASQYADTAIIARTMLEGLITLAWIGTQPTTRANAWRA